MAEGKFDRNDKAAGCLRKIMQNPELSEMVDRIIKHKTRSLYAEDGRSGYSSEIEKSMWVYLEAEIAHKIMPVRISEDGGVKKFEADTKLINETVELLKGYVVIGSQITYATQRVSSDKLLWDELKDAALLARRHPTPENEARAHSAQKAIVDKAESYLTITKSDALREQLEKSLEIKSTKLINDAAGKEEAEQERPAEKNPMKNEAKPVSPARLRGYAVNVEQGVRVV